MHIRLLLLLLGMSLFLSGAGAQEAFRERRESMVSETIAGRDITDEAVLSAMRSVPRHNFVRSRHVDRAYDDTPIPIGHGQTISQPYIVAFMTQIIDLQPGDRVLEVGTGSGYQAAVLAEIVDEVYTIEIIEELADWGESNLRESGYTNVRVKNADGYYGWEEHAPFDAIVVTAAAGSIPPPLVDQLKEDGRMIIPVGSPFRVQRLMLVEREDGEVRTRSLMPVRFVPFRRAEEQQ